MSNSHEYRNKNNQRNTLREMSLNEFLPDIIAENGMTMILDEDLYDSTFKVSYTETVRKELIMLESSVQ